MPSSPERRPYRSFLVLLAAVAAAAAPWQAAEPQAPPPSPSSSPQMQGLPPAPPPSGIRPSQRPAEPQAPPDGPLPRRAATRALDEALVPEVRALEGLLDPGGGAAGGLGALNAAAGGDAVVLDPRLVELLERALAFCLWSGQAHGPLGGGLYALWGFESGSPEHATGRPAAAALRRASDAAGCDRLRLDAASAQAQLATGSRVEPWGFARGFLADRAMAVLVEHGAEDAWVELGWVRRARGSRDEPGSPEDHGRGWPVTLPVFPGQHRPLDRVWLRDEALAVASALHRPLLVGGDRHAPFLDQRNGRPAEGVTGVVTVTELAVDAEALAAALMILGNREGLLRAGVLRPSPAVLWLLGGGEGVPVQAQHDWSRIALR